MLLDSLGMRPLGDEEGGAGVSQVVNPEAFRNAESYFTTTRVVVSGSVPYGSGRSSTDHLQAIVPANGHATLHGVGIGGVGSGSHTHADTRPYRHICATDRRARPPIIAGYALPENRGRSPDQPISTEIS